MEEAKKYGKTLEEIEGGLMFDDFPESLADSDEDHNIFDDEFDAANEETFGDVLDNAELENAELENYATQTARLRLDDPVWQTPSSSEHVTSSASGVPVTYPIFGNGNMGETFKSSFEAESPFLKKSIWGNDTNNTFNIWSSDFVPTSSTLDLDFAPLLPNDNSQSNEDTKFVKPIQIPSMPTSALRLQDFEKMQLKNQTDPLAESLNNLNHGSISTQQKIPPPSSKPTAVLPATEKQSVIPSIPVSAISVEELEQQLVQKTLKVKPPQPNQPSSPESSSPMHPPPGFNQHISSRSEPTMPSVGLPDMSLHLMGPILPLMGQMFPPPIMQLPKLPPLNPQFLPLVPAWLNAIMNNIQLPMGAPPPPPFLFQLLNHYRNPQLVHAMIIQSSIPPNIRAHCSQFPPPPGSHSSISRNQRRNSGMPISRTIYDLALDSFAGFMSYKEREWLIRIQFIQCKGSGDSYVDDYYYMMWREKQIANGWTAGPKSMEQKNNSPGEAHENSLEHIRRMNYRGKQKERAREREKERQERIDRGEDRKPRQTLADMFSTSLGMPSKSSTHNPRHVLDMKTQVDSVDNQTKRITDEERKIAVAKKLRTMLLRLEGALTLLMEVDELRKQSIFEKSRFKDLTSEEKDQEVKKRTTLIIHELMGDDLSKLLQMSKGRTVIVRTFNVVDARDQASIVIAIISAGRLINRKMYGEIILDILPVLYQKVAMLNQDQFKILVGALNLDFLNRQILDNNAFIRDIILTLIFISQRNHHPLLQWAKVVKLPSLKMSSNASLVFWRKALSFISDNDIKDFAQDIKHSGIVDAYDVFALLEQSL